MTDRLSTDRTTTSAFASSASTSMGVHWSGRTRRASTAISVSPQGFGDVRKNFGQPRWHIVPKRLSRDVGQRSQVSGGLAAGEKVVAIGRQKVRIVLESARVEREAGSRR